VTTKRSLPLFWVLAVLLLVLFPAVAQNENPGPGEGGPIIEPNFGGDIANLNPILINDGVSADLAALIYPALLGISPESFALEPNQAGGLVTDYSISEDGRTYTFTLRDDWTWSDGTPITSMDYKYAFDAIASGETDSALGYVLDVIQSVEAPDEQTLVVTAHEADCSLLNNANFVPIVPSHVYMEQFGTDYAAMNSAEINLNPPVTAGPFEFSNFRPGEQVTLVANQNYPDAQLGYVVPEGYILKTITDQTLMVEQFLAGEVTWINSVPEDRRDELQAMAEAGEVQWTEGPAITIQFIAFNAADPSNPLNGLDEDGNPIDQGHHPILSDVRVRQALVLGTDWDALNEGALSGDGWRVTSHALPTSWAFNEDIEPYPFDLEAATALLEEAGWVDDDNDPSTPRVAQGAQYAEDGTPLAFSLLTNAGNTGNEAMGVLLQDQWRALGVDLDFQAIEFNTLVDTLVGQTYDSVLLFWQFAVPDDPSGISATFGPENDLVGSGFNVTSYNNPEVTRLLDEAKTLPGCDPAQRAELYGQVLQILHDEVPWFWVATSIVPSVARGDLGNWEPIVGYPLRYNIDAWAVPQP
jgi:peptide/nickel transport system substrate-binding protein